MKFITMPTNVPGHHPCQLFYITDRTNGLCFLVDTRAEVSVIPPSPADCNHHKNNLTLQAVNDTSITWYGNRLLILNIGIRHTYQWVSSVIADVKNPIMGADFLRNFSILMDLTHNRLMNGFTSSRNFSTTSIPQYNSNPPVLHCYPNSQLPSLRLY